MKSSRILVLVGVLGVAGALGAYASSKTRPVAGRAPASSLEAPSRKPETTAPAPAPSPVAVDTWPIGQARHYHAQSTSRVEGQGSEGAAGVTNAKAELDLELVAVDVDRGRTRVRGVLHAAKLEYDGGDEVLDRTEELNRAMSRPFAFAVEPRGRIAELYLDRGLDSFGDGYVRTLLSALQFVAPDAGAAGQWTAEESDSSGRVVAAYRRTDTGFAKMALRFRDGDGRGPMPVNRVRNLSADITRAESGLVTNVRRQESQRATFSGVQLHAESSTSLHLTSVATGAVPPLDLAGTRVLHLEDGPSSTADGGERLQSLARGHTVRELSDTLSNRGLAENERHAAIEQLAAVVATGGRAAAQELSRRVRAAPSAGAAQEMLGALISAGDAESQRALAELAGDATASKELRMGAMMGLGTGETPTTETLARLQRLAGDPALPADVHDAALRALGAAAGDREGADPATNQAATASAEYLIDRLKEAKNPSETALYADAIGNSGRPEALPTLKDLAQSDDPRLRSSALEAMRRMAGPDVDAVLANALVHDPDPGVRSDALGALRYHALTPPTVEALVSAIKYDQSASQRHAAVAVAQMNTDDYPELMSVIAWASEHDSDPDVRAAARGYLSNLGSAPAPR